MPLFEVNDSGLKRQPIAAFAALGLYERDDLQRRLRDDISALGEDLLVIAEEFREWEDARRRIDLLALDKAGRLVVIELKRTDDGGHMELQAIRYAAMVSSMGFDDVLRVFSEHRTKHAGGAEIDPRAELVAFLEADEDDAPVISSEVRIILVSADFGREITTAVLWLNGFDGMDIRCVRLVPYEIEGKVFLDIQQVIPLPEAADYQVRLRRKDAARERARAEGRDYSRYHVVVAGAELPAENKRHAMRVLIERLAASGVSLDAIRSHLPERKMRVVSGLFSDAEAVRKALLVADPKTAVDRWFCEHPMVDVAIVQTYVLSNQWGTDTEPTLKLLSETFPEAKVTFRRAVESD